MFWNLFQKEKAHYWVEKLKEKSVESKLVEIEELKLSMSDKELLKLSKNWKEASEKLKTKITDIWKSWLKYYIWNNPETNTKFDKHNVIDNRIFLWIETVAPVITANPAVPVVFHAQETKESKELAAQHQKIMLATYQKLKMKPKLEKVYKHNQIWKLWVMKYWIENWKIFTDYVIPEKLYIDPDATTVEDAEFIWQTYFKSWWELVKEYPDLETQIRDDLVGKMWTRVKMIEWWTDKYTFKTYEWKTRIVVDKKRNPHFNYSDLDKWWENPEDDFEMKDIDSKSTNNVFSHPKKPFVFYQVFNLWLSVIDDTTNLEQSKSPQDAINLRKRQIWINISTSWNPIKISKWLNQSQFDEYINWLQPWDWVNLSSSQEISYLQAQGLTADAQNDIIDNRQIVDNNYWSQATFRWERQGQETAQWREILQQWSENRQATPWWALEIMLEELYIAWSQLIKVHYSEKELLPLLWEKTSEYVEFSSDSIEDWVELRVKAWSMLPDDKIAQKAEALQLKWMWSITLAEMYQRLGWENPDEAANNFYKEEAKMQKKQQEILQWEKEAEVEAWMKEKNFEALQAQIQNLT